MFSVYGVERAMRAAITLYLFHCSIWRETNIVESRLTIVSRLFETNGGETELSEGRSTLDVQFRNESR